MLKNENHIRCMWKATKSDKLSSVTHRRDITVFSWVLFMFFCVWGRQTDWWAYGEHGAVAQLTASDMTQMTAPGGVKWRVPDSTQSLYFPGLLFLVWFSVSVRVDQAQRNLLLLLLFYFLLFYQSPPYFTLNPSLAPHSPPAPSRCVNQYSLLIHDSPHMSSTASGLHWGAGIAYTCMCVCSHEWVQLWCVFSLFLCVCVHTCVCMCVNAWKSTRLAGAFSKGLLLSAQINLLSPWVNTLIHLCIWLHVVCVSACVCKHANPGEGLA